VPACERQRPARARKQQQGGRAGGQAAVPLISVPSLPEGHMPCKRTPSHTPSPQQSKQSSRCHLHAPSQRHSVRCLRAAVSGIHWESGASACVSPIPHIYTLGVSPISHIYTLGVSPISHIYTLGVSPISHIYTLGVSPIPHIYTLGVSPIPHIYTLGERRERVRITQVRYIYMIRTHSTSAMSRARPASVPAGIFQYRSSLAPQVLHTNTGSEV
jgi:hypothetical protein